jgi:hypothetical protein
MDAINVIRTAEAILPEVKLDYSNLKDIKNKLSKQNFQTLCQGNLIPYLTQKLKSDTRLRLKLLNI